MGKHGLSLCSLPFGLSGSLCLTKLKFSAQRLLILNRSHKFYKLVTHVIIQNNLCCPPALMCCCHIHPWKILDGQELGITHPDWVLAGVPARRGVLQSYLLTNLVWYLPCLQLFLSFFSQQFWNSFLLLIKITNNNSVFLKTSTSCLGNVSLIIYTHPTSSSTPNLNLCFTVR